MIERIHENEDFLKVLFKKGLLSSSFFMYYNIALAVDREQKLGHKKSQAVTNVSIEFNVSEQTVYIALKKML